jgi:hypothetical protein
LTGNIDKANAIEARANYVACNAMPVAVRDLDAYRRDERLGGKLLTPEERAKLLKVSSR